MSRTLLAVATLGLVLTFSGTCLAAGDPIPPGNSSADEYTEGVPGAGGSTPSIGFQAQGEGDAGKTLPPDVVEQLQTEGELGARAASTLEATAPERGGGHTGDDGRPPDASSDGLGPAVASALGGSDGGMGLALPVILISALLGAVAVAVLRRRSAGHTPLG